MRISGGEIMVVGNEVDLITPIRVIHHALVGRYHEIRGKWFVRTNIFDGIAFRDI